MTACATLPALARYAVALGDDALILAQRCGELITHAPQLEEDVALANIGLDLLGQARALLTYAGEVEGAGRDEDDLTYLREERDFLNVHLVELTGGDFAFTIARLLAFATYQVELYQALAQSTDDTLAGIAAKAVKEVSYHRAHATEWTLRLGDGTALSHERMQNALETVVPYTAELFDNSWLPDRLAADGVAVDPAGMRSGWEAYLRQVTDAATLTWPSAPAATGGGRQGLHTEAMGYLLAEMQHLHRSHPGATW